MPWMVFADGLSSEDHFPVLWEDRKDRGGYKYSKHGDGFVYTETPHWECNRTYTDTYTDNMRQIYIYESKEVKQMFRVHIM